MWAWYLRVLTTAEMSGQPAPTAPWAPAGGVMDTVTWHWTRPQLERAYAALTEANRRGVPVEIWGDD
jgi:hypothetical protein